VDIVVANPPLTFIISHQAKRKTTERALDISQENILRPRLGLRLKSAFFYAQIAIENYTLAL
jgi:hypothetical protein